MPPTEELDRELLLERELLVTGVLLLERDELTLVPSQTPRAVQACCQALPTPGS